MKLHVKIIEFSLFKTLLHVVQVLVHDRVFFDNTVTYLFCWC